MTRPFQDLLLDLEQAEGDEEKSTAILAELATRIDEIKAHTDDLDAQGVGLRAEAALITKARVAPLIAAASAREKKAARILARICWFMEQRQFEALPGKTWRMDLRTNQATVDINDDACADAVMKLKYPAFIKRSVSYDWDKKAIREALEGENPPELPASLKYNKRVEFEVKK